MRYVEKEAPIGGKSGGIWEYDVENDQIVSSVAKRYQQSQIKVFKGHIDPNTGKMVKDEFLRYEDISGSKVEYQLIFRRSLVALCDAHDLTSKELAEIVGISRQAVSHWFRDTVPQLCDFAKVCHYFGLPMDSFLRRNEEKCKKKHFTTHTIYDMLREMEVRCKNEKSLKKEVKAQFIKGRMIRLRHIWYACDLYECSLDWLWGVAEDGLAQEIEEAKDSC